MIVLKANARQAARLGSPRTTNARLVLGRISITERIPVVDSTRVSQRTQVEPKTMVEAIRFLSDAATCVKYIAERRWPDGPICPKSGGKEHSYLSTRLLWKCKPCKKQFSVKVGTIFEDSPLGLDKWLPAVWLLTGSRNGVSSMELHRSLGATQRPHGL